LLEAEQKLTGFQSERVLESTKNRNEIKEIIDNNFEFIVKAVEKHEC
jgi:hypothetical protein